ncbi:GntR family transcriptional regulator [Streptomyces fructofermentans]|uniref:HTH-type transcriptional repressor YvoA n=1 Tax=Streptomyces fructofermentans TaxID=152141 RepID=A0A918NDM5_9ACTN|nr:GntR family transcriptional regulator [Streptomyces fructofermentans]GGX62616.1 HTH-type transcriptional repressor YvoA [Streptomyces fructofermentans]
MTPSRPLYERIERQLRARLDAAADGDPFPSETQLAREFGVARMTVRAALAGLERDGRLDRVPGRGTFVRKAASARPVGTLLSFHDEVLASGRTPGSRVLEAVVRAASPEEAAALHPHAPSRSADVVAITRVRLSDDVPLAVERATFPASLGALLDTDLETGSLHAALRRLGFSPTLGSSLLSARTADADAGELGVAATTPMLVETRSIADQHGDPLEHTVTSYVASRYTLRVDFTVSAPAPTADADEAAPRVP